MSTADQRAQTIARTMMSHEGTAPEWGLEYVDGGVGWAKVRFLVTKKMLNGYGVIHGGLIFSLADAAFAYACNSRNQKAVAQQASISFLSPVEPGEILVAEAKEQSVVGRSGVYNVTVSVENGRSVAHFQGLSRVIRGQIVNE